VVSIALAAGVAQDQTATPSHKQPVWPSRGKLVKPISLFGHAGRPSGERSDRVRRRVVEDLHDPEKVILGRGPDRDRVRVGRCAYSSSLAATPRCHRARHIVGSMLIHVLPSSTVGWNLCPRPSTCLLMMFQPCCSVVACECQRHLKTDPLSVVGFEGGSVSRVPTARSRKCDGTIN
jgi:hypothetical protein